MKDYFHIYYILFAKKYMNVYFPKLSFYLKICYTMNVLIHNGEKDDYNLLWTFKFYVQYKR